MMTPKIKSILIKIVRVLKSKGWEINADYQISFKFDNSILLSKNISTNTPHGDNNLGTEVPITIEVGLLNLDGMTYYPHAKVSGEIFVQGGTIQSVDGDVDVDVTFTEQDSVDINKINAAASKLNSNVVEFVNDRFEAYASTSSGDISNYRSGGWKADQDLNR